VPMPLRNGFELRHDIAIHVTPAERGFWPTSPTISLAASVIIIQSGIRHADVRREMFREIGGREKALIKAVDARVERLVVETATRG
jgi:hypothetical protein